MTLKTLKLLCVLFLIAVLCWTGHSLVSAANLFSDDFEDGNSTGWSTSGGSWSVVTDGSKVYKQAGASANAYSYTGNSAWTDYSVQVRAKALSFNGTGRTFGITARYSSTSNYYYLAISNANQLQLGKKSSTGSGVLASKTFTAQTGTWYTLKLAVIGNQLQAYVDGVLQLTATDSSLKAGKAGLLALYTSAEFDDVAVEGTNPATPTPIATLTATPTPTTTSSLAPTPPTSATPTPTGTPAITPTPINPADGPIGFASVNAMGQNGTTGGAGGPTVTVTTTEQFLDYISRPGPYIIRVVGTITLPRGTTDGMHSVASDKSILGVGSNAALVGGGLLIGLPMDDAVTAPPANAVHNIIIRNLSFSGASDDAINVQMFSHHIWIDHCDLSNGGDGLVDIKRGSDYVTVSWNRFHDHYKTSLLGHDDANGAQDAGRLRVTYHHNFFDRSDQRNPRVRFSALCHVYNNYYYDNSYGVVSVCDARLMLEGNYFYSVNNPGRVIFSGTEGYIVQRHNILVDCNHPIEERGPVPEPSTYYRYTLDDEALIPSIVPLGAGVGKLNL